MDKHEQIRLGIAEIAKRYGPLNSVLASVLSVDETEKTCVLDLDGIELPDVRLAPVINSKQSSIAFPAVGSFVLAVRIEGDDDWMVIAADEITKYRVTIGDMVFEMDGEKFLIKKGEENLLQLMNDLIDGIENASWITSNGPTTGMFPASATVLTAIKTRFNNLLKSE
jgi:hypothetical protein